MEIGRDTTMAVDCEICVVIVADGSVMQKWEVHSAAAELRLELFRNVLSIEGEKYAGYYRDKPITRCIVEALTPELMKHKMETGDYTNKVFRGSSEKLAVFLVVEISEPVSVDDTTDAFDADFFCVVDAKISSETKTTHEIAAVIDALIMDGKPVNIANEHGDIVQVAPHVITFVLTALSESVFSANRFKFLVDGVVSIINTARTINPDK